MLCILLTLMCGCEKQNVKEITYTDFVMDTVLSEKMYAEKDYSRDLQNVLKDLENEELSWRVAGSEIAKMNDSFHTQKSFDMSDQMTEWVKSSLQLARDSQGAFDPTIGNLSRLWNIEGENPTVPSEEEIRTCISQVGYQKVAVKENTIIIEETASIDLGACGKGIACDVACHYLESKEDVTGASISVGGSILTYGSKPDGGSWNVAIQKPDGMAGEVMGVLHVDGTNYVSTSGDYEKYFEQDGKRYHHILDPATGYPSQSDLSSVTILCDNGLFSDGLSTACYVLGVEKSEILLENYNATAIFIDHEKNVTIMGPDRDKFELLDQSFKMVDR